MTTFAVSLLSGGLDSTTVTTLAKQQVSEITALTFQYGQSHSKEVRSAQQIASILGIEHKLMDISFLREIAWYSALTNPGLFPIPSDRSESVMGISIPITYVPLRNTIFVSLAAGLLESKVLNAIEVENVPPEQVNAKLYMAPNAIDYSGYPDCRPEFFEQLSVALQLGSKLGVEYGISIEIETPIIEMSKAEIVNLATELGAPLGQTWSCYEALELPCGRCDSCILRAKGFADAGLPDPLLSKRGAS